MKIIFLFSFTILSLFAMDPIVTGKWLNKHIDDDKLIIIDVRKAISYRLEHVPNAVHTSLEKWRMPKNLAASQVRSIPELESEMRTLGINKDSKVVIYSDNLSNKNMLKATYILWAMEYAGLKNSALLDGGMNAYTAHGGKLSSRTNTPKYGNYLAVKNNNLIINMSDIAALILKVPIIDSRPAVYYFGSQRQAVLKRAGHIPSATSYFWKYNMTEENKIKDKITLTQTIEEGLGLDKTKPLVVYCTGGLEASMNYFVLHRVLGFKKAVLYDASMKEWANNDNTEMMKYRWE